MRMLPLPPVTNDKNEHNVAKLCSAVYSSHNQRLSRVGAPLVSQGKHIDVTQRQCLADPTMRPLAEAVFAEAVAAHKLRTEHSWQVEELQAKYDMLLRLHDAAGKQSSN